MVQQQFAYDISVQTMQKALKFVGWMAHVKKNLFSHKNIKAQLEFAMSHLPRQLMTRRN